MSINEPPRLPPLRLLRIETKRSTSINDPSRLCGWPFSLLRALTTASTSMSEPPRLPLLLKSEMKASISMRPSRLCG